MAVPEGLLSRTRPAAFGRDAGACSGTHIFDLQHRWIGRLVNRPATAQREVDDWIERRVAFARFRMAPEFFPIEEKIALDGET